MVGYCKRVDVMFDEWGKRRELKKRIASLKKEEAAFRANADAEPPEDPWQPPKPLPEELNFALGSAKRQLEDLETDLLVRKARRLGIEIPNTRSWWWDDSDYVDSPEDVSFLLTDIGKAGVSRLIREDRRKSIETWVKIITPILSALIALLGLIVALVSVSKK
jgi:hypothetical protein